METRQEARKEKQQKNLSENSDKADIRCKIFFIEIMEKKKKVFNLVSFDYSVSYNYPKQGYKIPPQ